MSNAKAKAEEYVNVSAGPVQIAVGRMLPVGEASDQVDPKNPADEALINEGLLALKED
jgi:hypothetical protein